MPQCTRAHPAHAHLCSAVVCRGHRFLLPSLLLFLETTPPKLSVVKGPDVTVQQVGRPMGDGTCQL